MKKKSPYCLKKINYLLIFFCFLSCNYSLDSLAEVSSYIGLDANYQKLFIRSKTGINPDQEINNSLDFYKTQTIAPNIYFGFDNGRNLRIELGGSRMSAIKTKNDAFQEGSYFISTKFKLTSQVYSIEFKPYLDINNKFLIYGIAGLNYYRILLEREAYSDVLNRRYSDYERSNSKIYAPTIGFGGEYSFNSHVFVRSQLKYSHLDTKVKYIENNRELIKYRAAIVASLGLGYRF